MQWVRYYYCSSRYLDILVVLFVDYYHYYELSSRFELRGLSCYIIKSQTVDHSGCRVCRVDLKKNKHRYKRLISNCSYQTSTIFPVGIKSICPIYHIPLSCVYGFYIYCWTCLSCVCMKYFLMDLTNQQLVKSNRISTKLRQK